jgi:3alpha(or 20beta)-hydroxysteroid dehydrogenase
MTGSAVVATDVLDAAPDDFAKVYRQVVAVNQVGCFPGMRAALPVMRAAGTGSITTISSIAGMGGSVPASERIGRYRW